ncbi:hypothetical protein [Nocardia sp. NPDC051832]
MTLVFGALILLGGGRSIEVWAIMTALGLGALTAAVLCMGWDLWLHP